MKIIAVAMTIAAIALTGCATKRYPIATPLGLSEESMLTCRDIDLEVARAEQARRQIGATAKIDWRSAAGFLGDFGIGNAMAKSDAQRAINNRIAALSRAGAAKDCVAAD